jgi:uncharacterized protein
VERGEKLYAAQPALEDLEHAFRHCRPLAEAGDAEAQYYFAVVHMFRTPSQPPDNPAVDLWMKRSAEGGHGSAQFYMATAYRTGGRNTPRDMAKALEMYEKAALNGVPPAPLELGRIWRWGGYGFPPDEAKAIHWYEFAATKFGMDDAMRALIEIYAEDDPEKSAYWKAKLERTPCCR